MSTPNEHLQRAESLIEQLEAALTEHPKYAPQDGAKLAELHLMAANARTNIRTAYTLQALAALMSGDDDTPPTDPPGESPWTPTRSNVRPLPLRTSKPT